MTQIEKLEVMKQVAWMDAMVRENFDDEDIIDEWLTLGVPDHIGDIPMEDLEWYADNPSEYEYLGKLFDRLSKEAGC